MNKALEAFRTISEVAGDLDVPKHVLRFWEVKFPQIRPMKRGGGRRYYRPEDLILLRGIQHLLHAEGYTIKGVQKILREQGIEQVKHYGLAAGLEGVTPSPAEAKRIPAAKAPPQPAPSHRVRSLPKSLKRDPLRSPMTNPAVDMAWFATLIGELRACRDVLAGPASAARPAPAASAATAGEARRAKAARSTR